jgi:hypothetical protein
VDLRLRDLARHVAHRRRGPSLVDLGVTVGALLGAGVILAQYVARDDSRLREARSIRRRGLAAARAGYHQEAQPLHARSVRLFGIRRAMIEG